MTWYTDTRWEKDIFFHWCKCIFFAINETLCSRLTRVLPHCWGNPFPRLLSLSPSALEQLVSDRDRWLLCYVYSFVTRHSDWLLCGFFSEELVGTCSDTSSNNLLKSVHHHYRVRGAVVCREWERGSENWRLNGRRSAAGSDSTRWKKSSSAPLLMTRFFLDYLHSCSLASSLIRSCLCLCIDAFLGTTQTHIILSPVALLHFWVFFYSLNYCFTKLSSHDTCWYPKWAMGRVGGGT